MQTDQPGGGKFAHRSAAYRNRFYISNKYKICYASVDKVANTGIKWWMAGIEGLTHDVEHVIVQQGLPKNPKAIHTAYPMVARHLVLDSFGQIKKLFDSKQYFCFSVVRNPYTRTFSAWADKVLTGIHIHTRKRLHGEAFYDKPILTIQDAVKGFESFVSWLESGPDALQSDRHWMPQFLLLRPDILGYDYIGKMENRDEIDQRLSSAVGEEHGGPFGKERVLNKSLLSYHPDLVTEKAKESIRILYADDFKTFGYDDTVLPARGLPLEKSAVEKTLLRVFIKRAQSAQRKLVTLEAEREALETNPLVALKQLGKACLCPLRYSWSRLRHRV